MTKYLKVTANGRRDWLSDIGSGTVKYIYNTVNDNNLESGTCGVPEVFKGAQLVICRLLIKLGYLAYAEAEESTNGGKKSGANKKRTATTV